MTALRIASVRQCRSLHQLSVIHLLVIILYVFGSLFCFFSAILVFGYGTQASRPCSLAITVCLVFYLGHKLPLYAFLVERTHVVRSVTRRRLQDWFYIFGMLSVILGFGSIVVCLFIWDVWLYDPVIKRCRIGFRVSVALALLLFDIIVNLWLTCVFVHYLRPYLTKGLLKAFVPKGISDLMTSQVSKHAVPNTDLTISIAIPQVALIRVIRNTIIGCIAMCAATVANCLAIILLHGHEEVWMCFTFCTLEGTSSHYLRQGCYEARSSSLQRILPCIICLPW